MELESELSLLEVSESEFEFDYQRMLVSELESVPKFSDSPALLISYLSGLGIILVLRFLHRVIASCNVGR